MSISGGKSMQERKNEESLDQEWIELMKQAKDVGFTKDEVHTFLLETAEKNELQQTAVVKV